MKRRIGPNSDGIIPYIPALNLLPQNKEDLEDTDN